METKITQIEILEIEDDDELCFTSAQKKGTTKQNAISVEQYNEDRDIRHTIRASLSQNLIDLDDYYDDDELHVLNFVPHNTLFGKKYKPFSSPSFTEKGQSSNSKKEADPGFVCEICVEAKTANESFSAKGCSHSYCNDCMMKYVASKLQENITSISCPASNCKGLLEPEYCRNILPRNVLDRWDDALCEAVILGAQKFYCPYKDCSALLIDDGEVIRESECPCCRRLFCAQCKVPWHSGIKCVEFQKLNKDEKEREDILLMKMAQKNNWKRCPNCRYYVEKQDGCMYMKCRCGAAFCYNCGTASDKFSDQYHYCTSCQR